MTPAVAGTKLYAASVGGVFYIMDGEGLSVSGQVKTPATQPYAAAPLVSGGYAYFVDRKGLAVCIDLGAQTVAWSKRVDAGKNLNVLQDPVLGDSGLYVFAKATIYGLSSKTGERLFEPIGGVSSPPAIEGGAYWFGTQDDKIVAVDPLSGKTRATLPVSARVIGAPVESGDLLAFPTESGEAIFVNPAADASKAAFYAFPDSPCFIGRRFLGPSRPAGGAFGQQGANAHVAVLRFANETSSTSYDAACKAATDTLVLTLTQLGRYRVHRRKVWQRGRGAAGDGRGKAPRLHHVREDVQSGSGGIDCRLSVFDRAKGTTTLSQTRKAAGVLDSSTPRTSSWSRCWSR